MLPGISESQIQADIQIALTNPSQNPPASLSAPSRKPNTINSAFGFIYLKSIAFIAKCSNHLQHVRHID